MGIGFFAFQKWINYNAANTKLPAKMIADFLVVYNYNKHENVIMLFKKGLSRYFKNYNINRLKIRSFKDGDFYELEL